MLHEVGKKRSEGKERTKMEIDADAGAVDMKFRDGYWLELAAVREGRGRFRRRGS